MQKITAGRDEMGEFAPKFAEINDDVLFGQVWSREDKLSHRDRSLITISALVGAGILNGPLESHLRIGRANGISAEEISEVLTQLAFYTGWPKAWTALRLAKDIYEED